jgi:hypothetical protein
MPSTRLLKLNLDAFSFCSAAWQEVDLAIAADIGTLQRLPGIVGDGKSIPSLQYCTMSGEPGFARHILCTSYRTPLPFHDHTGMLVWFLSLHVCVNKASIQYCTFNTSISTFGAEDISAPCRKISSISIVKHVHTIRERQYSCTHDWSDWPPSSYY